MNFDTTRDWEDKSYWHRECVDCNKEFNGPKREAQCRLCYEQKQQSLETYRIDVQVTGYETITTQVTSLEQAKDNVLSEIFNRKVIDLRQKRVEIDVLDKE